MSPSQAPTTMLFKCPGPHKLHDIQVDYIVVESSKVEEHLVEGWRLTTGEAKVAFDKKSQKVDAESQRPMVKKQFK